MLKTRVIPIVLLKDGEITVKSVQFGWLRPVGHPVNSVRVYNARNVDELIFLDISATKLNRGPLLSIVPEILDECFMPLTVGGGIKNLSDIHALLNIGADKVAINTSAVENPNLIKDAAFKFGNQCIVVSIDVKKNSNGSYEIYTRCGSHPTGLDPIKWAKKMERYGAGEILLNSIDKDGTEEGYDIALIRSVAESLNIPVIAAGGAGKLDDFIAAVKDGRASAVAAGSVYLFTDITPNMVKLGMKNAGINTRI